MIKLLSVDTLRSLQMPIDHKIKCVPALYLVEGKKFLFGKEVFDYLILKNKLTFAGETTRDHKKNKDTLNADAANKQVEQPQAFSLGAISAEYFSSIDDADSMISDRNYKWDLLSNLPIEDSDLPVNAIGQVTALKGPAPTTEPKPKDENKKLPTMEEIMKQRASDIL